jgi:hypothetical protein
MSLFNEAMENELKFLGYVNYTFIRITVAPFGA